MDGSSDPRNPLAERLATIVANLAKQAGERVQRRAELEKRWLEDLRQYQGVYEPETDRELKGAGKSRIFIPKTRAKTNAVAARLGDMLFPTDDKNWSVQPTPDPDLAQQAKEAADKAALAAREASIASRQGQDPSAMVEAGNAAAEAAKAAQLRVEEARRRAAAMERLIEDQTVECGYPAAARLAILDAVKVGAGILKGPVGRTDRARRAWSQAAGAGWSMSFVDEPRPAVERVDYWSFFPDPDATEIQSGEGTFERHLMSRAEMRRLARKPGFDTAAIRDLLRADPKESTPVYITDLRAITGEQQAPVTNRYQVWEYRGPLSQDDIQTLCACAADRANAAGDQPAVERYAAMGADFADVDPLMEINVVVWFCDGRLLKFGIHHLDSGESIYSMFRILPDDGSVWGFGIPYAMRDPQRALNAAWRMMMDNAGLSTGPQIEVDESIIEPADGQWALTPRKIWRRKPAANPNAPGIRTYAINSHQAELANVIELATYASDEASGVTTLAEGEQGARTTQTAGGMSILMNAVNVVFRRMVKLWDDDVTVPVIRRLYDWNMQFHHDDAVKGDYEVHARGSSVLLTREIALQNLVAFVSWLGNPNVAPLLKAGPILRKVAQAGMIPADEVVLTPEEEEDMRRAAAQQPPPPDPETVKAQAQMRLVEMEMTGKLELARLTRETEMMRLAQQHNMKLDELRARLAVEDGRNQSKERIFAGEVAVESRKRAEAAARGEPTPPTGGGYV